MVGNAVRSPTETWSGVRGGGARAVTRRANARPVKGEGGSIGNTLLNRGLYWKRDGDSGGCGREKVVLGGTRKIFGCC